MLADLHIHTTASDGRLSPLEIVNEATRNRLSYIAITDHDTVEGVLALQNTYLPDLTMIPGIELNTDLPDYEVHILGYNIDIYNSQLTYELTKITEDRFTRAKKIVEKLKALGYHVEYSRILEIAGGTKAVGRPHIAKALLEKNYFTTMDEVFDVLLEKNGPAYVPHYKLTPKEAIKLVKMAGGIPVIAHPGLIGNIEIVLHLIQNGAQGMEVYHPKHSDIQTELYVSLANQYKLLITGGSDYHAIPGRFPDRLGQFTIPASLAEKLNQRSGIKR